MDLGHKTPRRHKNKRNCWKKLNGLKTEYPQKTRRQKRMLVKGPMDLG